MRSYDNLVNQISSTTTNLEELKQAQQMAADGFRVYKVMTDNTWDLDITGKSSGYSQLYKIKLNVDDAPDNAFTQILVKYEYTVTGLDYNTSICYDDPLAIYLRVFSAYGVSTSSEIKLKFVSVGLLTGSLTITEV